MVWCSLAGFYPAHAASNSQRENRTARCLTCLKVTVCLLHVFQRIALGYVNLHLATDHHVKQFIGHGLRAFAGGNVGEQGLPGQVQRCYAGCVWFGTLRLTFPD